jgi:hypothetical protein
MQTNNSDGDDYGAYIGSHRSFVRLMFAFALATFVVLAAMAWFLV